MNFAALRVLSGRPNNGNPCSPEFGVKLGAIASTGRSHPFTGEGLNVMAGGGVARRPAILGGSHE